MRMVNSMVECENSLPQSIEELTKAAHQRGNDIEIRSAKDGKIKVYEVKKTLIGVFDSTNK